MVTTPSDPLSGEDKSRIYAEERYRQEVRTQIAAAEPSGNKIIKFLSSPLGLWMLSAVVASAISTGYAFGVDWLKTRATKEETDRSQTRKTRDLIARLDLEISYRISTTLLNLAVADARSRPTEGTDVSAGKPQQADALPPKRPSAEVVALLVPLTFPSSAQRPPLFPEFNKYNVWALIAERRRHTPEDIERLTRVLARGPKYIVELEGSDRAPTPRLVAGELLDILKIPAWSRAFPYTDCSKEKPFC